jgi:glycerophosphoryl diester phosphodiesterase
VSPGEHPYLAGPYPRALVHRGWCLDELAGMENSLSALRRALDEGFRYLEIDVHATSDGEVVVCHDRTLDRTTDSSGPIAEQPWDRVREALVAGREPVPALRTVLEELPGALLNVDVKDDRAVRPVLRLLAETGAWDRVALAAFSAARLRRLRAAAGPRLITSCSPADALALRLRGWLPGAVPPGALGRLLPVPAAMAQLPRRQGPLPLVDRSLLRAAHAEGVEVHVWTINDPAEMRELLDLGVDGLVSDRPDLLRAELARRGQWPGTRDEPRPGR